MRLVSSACPAAAAGEMLHAAEPFLERQLHPTVIIRGYVKALEDALKVVDELAFPIDTNDREQMLKIIASCIGTKFTSRFGTLMPVSGGSQELHAAASEVFVVLGMLLILSEGCYGIFTYVGWWQLSVQQSQSVSAHCQEF